MADIYWRVVLFQESGIWIAQCLERDIAAQAKSIAELKKAFTLVVRRQAEIDIKCGRIPFDGIPQAPELFQDLYNRGEKLQDLMAIELSWPNQKHDSPAAHLAIAA